LLSSLFEPNWFQQLVVTVPFAEELCGGDEDEEKGVRPGGIAEPEIGAPKLEAAPDSPPGTPEGETKTNDEGMTARFFAQVLVVTNQKAA
jgi:hypothetical protein